MKLKVEKNRYILDLTHNEFKTLEAALDSATYAIEEMGSPKSYEDVIRFYNQLSKVQRELNETKKAD